MKKNNLRKLALLGVTGGLLIANPSLVADQEKPIAFNNDQPTKNKPKPKSDDNDGNLNYHLMTEDELLLELNAEGASTYNSLSPEGKLLARKVASMRCQGTNECKGLNGCQTPDNKCAGQGQCKGKGKCSISDKNLAVKLVSKKMAAKRANAAAE